VKWFLYTPVRKAFSKRMESGIGFAIAGYGFFFKSMML
jgi:hypothetical protein